MEQVRDAMLRNSLKSTRQQACALRLKMNAAFFVLRTIFSGRLISRFGDITWPSRSPDHAIPDYFLCGYVTSKIYETFLANIVDIKQRILEFIQGIAKERLQRVTTAFLPGPQECIERYGCHLQSVIFKQ